MHKINELLASNEFEKKAIENNIAQILKMLDLIKSIDKSNKVVTYRDFFNGIVEAHKELSSLIDGILFRLSSGLLQHERKKPEDQTTENLRHKNLAFDELKAVIRNHLKNLPIEAQQELSNISAYCNDFSHIKNTHFQVFLTEIENEPKESDKALLEKYLNDPLDRAVNPCILACTDLGILDGNHSNQLDNKIMNEITESFEDPNTKITASFLADLLPHKDRLFQAHRNLINLYNDIDLTNTQSFFNFVQATTDVIKEIVDIHYDKDSWTNMREAYKQLMAQDKDPLKPNLVSDSKKDDAIYNMLQAILGFKSTEADARTAARQQNQLKRDELRKQILRNIASTGLGIQVKPGQDLFDMTESLLYRYSAPLIDSRLGVSGGLFLFLDSFKKNIDIDSGDTYGCDHFNTLETYLLQSKPFIACLNEKKNLIQTQIQASSLYNDALNDDNSQSSASPKNAAPLHIDQQAAHKFHATLDRSKISDKEIHLFSIIMHNKNLKSDIQKNTNEAVPGGIDTIRYLRQIILNEIAAVNAENDKWHRKYIPFRKLPTTPLELLHTYLGQHLNEFKNITNPEQDLAKNIRTKNSHNSFMKQFTKETHHLHMFRSEHRALKKLANLMHEKAKKADQLKQKAPLLRGKDNKPFRDEKTFDSLRNSTNKNHQMRGQLFEPLMLMAKFDGFERDISTDIKKTYESHKKVTSLRQKLLLIEATDPFITINKSMKIDEPDSNLIGSPTRFTSNLTNRFEELMPIDTIDINNKAQCENYLKEFKALKADISDSILKHIEKLDRFSFPDYISLIKLEFIDYYNTFLDQRQVKPDFNAYSEDALSQVAHLISASKQSVKDLKAKAQEYITNLELYQQCRQEVLDIVKTMAADNQHNRDSNLKGLINKIESQSIFDTDYYSRAKNNEKTTTGGKQQASVQAIIDVKTISVQIKMNSLANELQAFSKLDDTQFKLRLQQYEKQTADIKQETTFAIGKTKSIVTAAEENLNGMLYLARSTTSNLTSSNVAPGN